MENRKYTTRKVNQGVGEFVIAMPLNFYEENRLDQTDESLDELINSGQLNYPDVWSYNINPRSSMPVMIPWIGGLSRKGDIV